VTLSAEEERAYDRDVAELGERVVTWLDRDQLGTLYSQVKDRAWSVVLGCYAKVAASLGPGNVPPEWTPRFDEHGMWRLP
jgi:hypothetical protein